MKKEEVWILIDAKFQVLRRLYNFVYRKYVKILDKKELFNCLKYIHSTINFIIKISSYALVV